MRDLTVNRFRARRGARLAALIADLSRTAGRPIRILDVGGRPDYWRNVPQTGVEKIVLLNLHPEELDRDATAGFAFETRVGNACDLSDHADRSIDLVHSNSVIEHVGDWPQMTAMARELRRVGARGWVQTPAWEFPYEPHFRLPFVHWFGRPAEAALIGLRYRQPRAERRALVDEINLLGRAEFTALFPDAAIAVERFVGWPKSYVATW